MLQLVSYKRYLHPNTNSIKCNRSLGFVVLRFIILLIFFKIFGILLSENIYLSKPFASLSDYDLNYYRIDV